MANELMIPAQLRKLLANGLVSRDMHRAVKKNRGQTLDAIAQAMKPSGMPIDLDDRLLCLGEPDWPDRFHGLPEIGGPWWLWVNGQRDALNAPRTVAIVGTRKASADGLELSYTIARDLAARGVVIVSGMANGIDQAAHRGCLVGGGQTIGVLGCGLDVDYPYGTQDLKTQIKSQGCLISEQTPGYPINFPGQFLERNRIIAALADAVVVIEAKQRSGALNTASWAGEYNRECLVVPASPNNKKATGSLALLRDGCQMVTSANDVLEAMGYRQKQLTLVEPDEPTLNGDLRRIYTLLGPDPIPVQTLVDHTGLTFVVVMRLCGELMRQGLALLDSDGIRAQ